MSADRPSPRPIYLGVGESEIRRTRDAETAGEEPAAQTIRLKHVLAEIHRARRTQMAEIGRAFGIPTHLLLTR